MLLLFKLRDEIGDTSGLDLELMLGELELANLLDSNRRSDMPGRGNRLPATHARGHSSPNQDGSGSSSDNLAYLTSRYVYININQKNMIQLKLYIS